MFGRKNNNYFWQEAIQTYTEALEIYTINETRLQTMRDLLGNNNLFLLNKIKRASNMCGECISRLKTLIKTIEERDYAKIHNQIQYIQGRIDEFEVLTKEINAEVQEMKEHQLSKQ